jgi:hypothetical protein
MNNGYRILALSNGGIGREVDYQSIHLPFVSYSSGCGSPHVSISRC